MSPAMNSARSEHKALDAILDQSSFPVERAAALEPVFEKFCATLRGMANLWTGASQPVSFRGLFAARLNETLSKSLGCVIARAKSSTQEHPPLFLLDRAGMTAIISSIFGTGVDVEPDEHLSLVEQALLTAYFGRATEALNLAFAGILETDFELDSTAVVSEESINTKRDAPVVSIHCEIGTPPAGGALTILLPLQFIQAIRHFLQPEPIREKPGNDVKWTRGLQAGVGATAIRVDALLDEFPMTLRAIANLSAGQMIELRTIDVNMIKLCCGDKPLFNCALGEESGRYALAIRESIGLETDPGANPSDSPL